MSHRNPVAILCATVAIAAIAVIGCGADSPANASDRTVVEPIEITSVEVTVGATRPAVVTVRVVGTLGNGCDYLHSIEQRREGNRITIDVRRTRFTGGTCTLQLKEFQEELGLPGTFAPGSYTVQVNGVSKGFSV